MDSQYIKNMPMKAPGLAIKAGSSALAKVSNTVPYKIDGSIYSVAAGDLPALTGINLAASQSVQLSVYVTKAGAFGIAAGTIVASPQTDALGNTIIGVRTNAGAVPAGAAVVGHIILTTDNSHTFTGGTTALDAAGITATYIDTFGYSGV